MGRIFGLVVVALIGTMAVMAPHAARAGGTPRHSFITIIAVGTFVREYCPNKEPNTVKLAALMQLGGFDLKSVTKSEMMTGQLLVNMWKQDTDRWCAIAWEKYGTDGSEIPGIIERD